MIQEEKKINDIFGKDNHFQVPAGYFDQLSDQIMAQIPEEKVVEFANLHFISKNFSAPKSAANPASVIV